LTHEAIKSPGLSAIGAMDSAESGIGDLDGLLEQVGCGGWQGAKAKAPVRLFSPGRI
jgi:hypothetical protein